MDDFAAHNPGISLEDWIIIGVAWDSSRGAVYSFLKETLPGETPARYLGTPIDYLAFPLSVWAKSALADRIGDGELKQALEIVYTTAYPDDVQKPKIYLAGHSFGSRILTAMSQANTWGPMVDRLQAQFPHLIDPTRLPTNYTFQAAISGALYVQPALGEVDLKRKRTYPVVITQSRHDHLNSLLFPISNLVLNQSYSRVYEEAYTQTAYQSNRLVRAYRIVYDIFRVPVSVASSGVLFPISYLKAQSQELRAQPLAYIPNSLAQIPVVETVVWAAEAPFRSKNEAFWGDDFKGVFNFGTSFESMGRITRQKPRHRSGSLKLPVTLSTNDLNVVNVDSWVDKSIFGVSMEERWFDFTLGWLDPVGSHAAFDTHPGTQKEPSEPDSVYRLLEELLAWQFFTKIPPAMAERDSVISLECFAPPR